MRVHGRIVSLVDLVIETFVNIQDFMTLEEFILLCPKMKSRAYTISSSNLEQPRTIGLTITLETVYGDSSFTGTASGHACDRLEPGEMLQHVLVKPSAFRLPQNSETPVIMVAAGTGVAPFRGFLRDMHVKPRSGSRMLFFGCTRHDVDWIYRSEMETFQNEGGQVVIAFSREGPEKLYVQDMILRRTEQVRTALEAGGVVYVCGAMKMCKGVEAALNRIVSVDQLKSQKRFIEEAWG